MAVDLDENADVDLTGYVRVNLDGVDVDLAGDPGGDADGVDLPVARSWLKKHFFTVALLASWLFHGVVLAWLGFFWPEVKPSPIEAIPVEIVFLPPPKKPVDPPKQVEAVAAEDHQAAAKPSEQKQAEVSPTPSEQKQVEVSPAPSEQKQAEVSPTPSEQKQAEVSPTVQTIPESALPVPPVARPPENSSSTSEPSSQETVSITSLFPQPPWIPPRAKPATQGKSDAAMPLVREPPPHPGSRVQTNAAIGSIPSRPAPAKPAKEPPMPHLSLNPSLGEMARWDQERHKREQEEVYKKQEETVSLNTQKVRYAAYFARLKERIQQGWVYPAEAKRAKLSGSVAMSFTINRSGEITGIQVSKSSGVLVLDEAALLAVQNVTPFMPLPDDWELEKLHVKTIFEYIRGGFKWSQ
ncbi:MAG: TonB family protein [Magnetococcus sp. YQC-5]